MTKITKSCGWEIRCLLLRFTAPPAFSMTYQS